jgi:hypothetical protein
MRSLEYRRSSSTARTASLELAVEAAVGREEEHLGQLLGDRTAAFHDAPAPEVLIDRPRDPHQVHAEVGVEARVFRGDDGFLEGGRHLGERHEDASLDMKFRDGFVVLVVDFRADARLEALQLGDGGQGARQDGQDPEGRDPGGEHTDGEDHHQRHDEEAHPAPAALRRLGG